MNKSEKPRRCTLQDIAARTGFTVNTVSRALKDKPDISLTTREQIKAVAEEMGYIRNQMASSLRSGRTRTLGVIVGGMSNPYYGILADAIHNAAAEHNYSIMILCSRDVAELELQAAESAISHQVDGIFLFPCKESAQTVDRMKKVGVPCVLMARKLENREDDCVICDDEQGAYLAVRHLIEAGHKKIGFISSYEVVFATPERNKGFHRACDEACIPAEDRFIDVCKPGRDTAARLLEWHKKGVTGVFFFCDEEAWHGIHMLDQAGIHVPRDMAVIGFDNLQGILDFPSPLCSINYDLHQMAREGLSLLRKRIHGEPLPPQEIILPPTLVCRSSCVRPHSAAGTNPR